jgi:hypothetical protein
LDYRHNPFEFLLRNFGQWVGAPGPGAFATPLDENPRAKYAIVRLKSPFSRFIPPFHAAGSSVSLRLSLFLAESHKQRGRRGKEVKMEGCANRYGSPSSQTPSPTTRAVSRPSRSVGGSDGCQRKQAPVVVLLKSEWVVVSKKKINTNSSHDGTQELNNFQLLTQGPAPN